MPICMAMSIAFDGEQVVDHCRKLWTQATSPRPAAATPAAAALYQKKPLYVGRTNAGPPQRSETTSMLTSSPSLHNGKSRFHSIARVLSGGI